MMRAGAHGAHSPGEGYVLDGLREQQHPAAILFERAKARAVYAQV
jgi:hypothetical protein